MAPRFTSFKSEVVDETKDLAWFRSIGALPLALAALAFVGVGVLLIFLAANGWRSVYPRYSDVLLVIAGVASIANAVLVFLTLVFFRRVWRRRTPAGQAEAERWDAFRRYLTDFPRLHEAPPATLELWERYLVYGIAFGIAERVLQGAHIHMPEALAQASAIYWISPNGDLGSGASALAIGDLASGLRERPGAAELAVAAGSPAAEAEVAAEVRRVGGGTRLGCGAPGLDAHRRGVHVAWRKASSARSAARASSRRESS